MVRKLIILARSHRPYKVEPQFLRTNRGFRGGPNRSCGARLLLISFGFATYVTRDRPISNGGPRAISYSEPRAEGGTTPENDNKSADQSSALTGLGVGYAQESGGGTPGQ
jgi:hypothetical protein